jgi:multiple sugar transport system substrate-binding protein/raffinose/stachyose/melibiose transport system substrate-binding protein
MNRFRIWAAPVAGTLALLLGACQPIPSRSVSLVHYFTGSLKAGVSELAQAINREGHGLELVPTPLDHEKFKTLIRVQLDGPNPPDLFSYWAGDKTETLVAGNLVSPLEEFWTKDIPAGTFPPGVTSAMSYGGKPFMLPLTRHYVGFFYSPNLFAKAGVPVPKTWDELTAAAARLADHGITPFAAGGLSRWPLQFWFDYLLLRQSGFEVRQRLAEGKVSWKAPEVTRAYAAWKVLVDKGWFNRDWAEIDWDAAALQVLHGQAAMTLMGTWTIGLYNEQKAAFPGDYGFFVFPVVDPKVPDVALGPIDGILMSARPRSPSDAGAILARLAEPEAQAAFNVAAGGVAPNSKVPDAAYPPLQRQIKALVEASPRWAFNFDLAFPGPIAEAGLDGFVAFLRNPGTLGTTLDKLEALRLGH